MHRSRIVVLFALVLWMAGALAFRPGTVLGLGSAAATPGWQSRTYLPHLANDPTPIPTPTPLPTPPSDAVVWDPRLDLRGAFVIPAQVQPGQGYWRLVKGVWYAEHEAPFDGQHHIFVDALNAYGQRQTGVPFRVTSLDGSEVWGNFVTEAKPSELYAGNYPMYRVAPSYRISPADGSPADAVSGLGLGVIERPLWTIHTSYGFVWRWSVNPGFALVPMW